MGLIHVTVEIKSDLRAKKSFSADFLIDAGATDSLVPEDALKRIRLRRVGKVSYELADGQVREFHFGVAIIEFMGEITSGRVIFGPEGSEPILGVTALESAGILVDPVRKTLKRLPAIPLKWSTTPNPPATVPSLSDSRLHLHQCPRDGPG